MKSNIFKFILVAMFTISSTSFTFAQKSNNFTDATETVYNDSKDVVQTVYGDGKSMVSTVYNDSKDIIGDLYPDVKSAVGEIAKGIGVAAEHVYTVLVKKFLVEGVKSLFIFVIGLALLLTGLIQLNNMTKTTVNWRIIIPVIYVIASAIILPKIDYNEMFMGLINPEYGAINYILDYSKSLLK